MRKQQASEFCCLCGKETSVVYGYEEVYCKQCHEDLDYYNEEDHYDDDE